MTRSIWMGLVVAAIAATPARAQSDIAWRLEPGERIDWAISVRTFVDAGALMRNTIDHDLDVRWTATGDAGDAVGVTLQFVRVRGRTRGDLGNDRGFDTAIEPARRTMFGDGRAARALCEASLGFALRPDGVVAAATKPGALAERGFDTMRLPLLACMFNAGATARPEATIAFGEADAPRITQRTTVVARSEHHVFATVAIDARGRGGAPWIGGGHVIYRPDVGRVVWCALRLVRRQNRGLAVTTTAIVTMRDRSAPAPTGETARHAIVVRSRESGDPLAGARVTIGGRVETTDADGRAAWPMALGSAFTVEAEGHATLSFVCVRPTTETAITLPRGATVRGRVLGPDERPLGARVVRAEPVAPRWLDVDGDTVAWVDSVFTVETENGDFRIDGVAPRVPMRFTATVVDPAASTRSLPSEAVAMVAVSDADDPPTVELRVPANGGIRGIVVDGAGQPVAGATVLLEFDLDPVRDEARMREGRVPAPPRLTTGADGRFVADGLEVSGWRVHVIGDAFPRVHQRVEIERHGQVVEMRVVVAAGLAIEGRVVDSNGAPVEGALVGANFGGSVVTDARGRFRLAQVQPAGNVVQAEGSGLLGAVAVRDVAAGTSDLRLVLPATAIVAGRVVDAKTGEPAPAVVRMPGASDDPLAALKRTLQPEALSERYSFGGVEPGPCVVVATTKDGRVGVLRCTAEGGVARDDVIRVAPGGRLQLVARRTDHESLDPLRRMFLSGGRCTIYDGDTRIVVLRIGPNPKPVVLPPGAYRLAFEYGGLDPKQPKGTLEKTATVTVGETTPVRFTIPAK